MSEPNKPEATEPEPHRSESIMQEQLTTSIVIASPPFSQIDGKEGVDLALVCAAFDHKVNLIFIEQGIFHLIEAQNEAFFDDKLQDKQLKALEFYDIEQIYVEQESLEILTLDSSQLIDSAKIISRATINQICRSGQATVTF